MTDDEHFIRVGFEGTVKPGGGKIEHMLIIPSSEDIFDGNGRITGEVSEWTAINTPTAVYAERLGRPNAYGHSPRYGVFVFDTENQMLFFKMRWWPVGGT